MPDTSTSFHRCNARTLLGLAGEETTHPVSGCEGPSPQIASSYLLHSLSGLRGEAGVRAGGVQLQEHLSWSFVLEPSINMFVDCWRRTSRPHIGRRRGSIAFGSRKRHYVAILVWGYWRLVASQPHNWRRGRDRGLSCPMTLRLLVIRTPLLLAYIRHTRHSRRKDRKVTKLRCFYRAKSESFEVVTIQ